MSSRMTKHVHMLITLMAILGLLGGSISAVSPASAADPTQEDELRIDYHDETGKASFIGADSDSPFELHGVPIGGLGAQDRSLLYLEHFAEILGLSEPARELQVIRTVGGGTGERSTVRYQQMYHGVPVLAGELIVNTDQRGGLLSISGEISPGLTLSTKPALSAAEAQAIAQGAVAKRYGFDAKEFAVSEPTLWIYDARLLLPSDRPAELVWRMDVRALNGEAIEELVLVNAQSGGVSLHFNQVDYSWSGFGTTPIDMTRDAVEESSVPSLDDHEYGSPMPVKDLRESKSGAGPRASNAQNTTTSDANPGRESIGGDRPALSTGTTWYVSTSGDDSNDCLSTTTECASVNAVLAKPGFTSGDTILVAVGTYTGTGSATIVQLVDDVVLSGGWDASFTTQTGQSTFDGENARRVVWVDYGVIASIENLNIRNGATVSPGDGIRNDGTLTVTDTILFENDIHNKYLSGWFDGDLTLNNTTLINTGIFNDNGTLILIDSTISGGGLNNKAGIATFNYSSINGGGITNRYSSSTLTLNNSTVSGNSGVGINNESLAKLILNNSTISGNLGGGIRASSGSVKLNSSTLSGNSASTGGGVYVYGSGTLTMRNSIIAGNTADSSPDCFGPVTSADYNLIGDTSGCTFTSGTGDLTDVDPVLGLLIGSPAYYPLLSSSPAIDAGNPAGCTDHLGNPLNSDQRGASRVGRCDIGAYEYTTPGPAAEIFTLEGTPQHTPPFTVFETLLKAHVLDSIGSPVQGVTVTFSAPDTGASGTFGDSGTYTTTAVSNESGVATAATFTANGIVGLYEVNATAAGVADPAIFQLGNIWWYVSPSGSDSDDCLSPATACTTINGVLAKTDFMAGDTVLVASGLYTGTGDQVVRLNKKVILSGGWDGTFSTQNGTSTIDGENVRRGLVVNGGVTATVEHFTFQNGHADWPGGGGGVSNYGNVTLVFSTVRGNWADDDGGGIYTDYGDLILKNSTVLNNEANEDGGGIYIDGGSLELINSTVSGNKTGRWGGGISKYDGTVALNSSTVSDNTAGSTGGGIEGPATLQNSILAGNIAGVSGPDCDSTISSLGYNLIGDTSGCTFTPVAGDLVDMDPSLGLLIGPSEAPLYYSLLSDSPAIDAGNPGGCTDSQANPLPNDQRGAPRVGRCDIGAYEYTVPGSAALVSAISGTPQSTPPYSKFEKKMVVAVLDSIGSPITGSTVTFAASESGASGTFEDSGTFSTSALSNESGVATAPDFTANGIKGDHTVMATVSGVADTADFLMTNGDGWYVSTTGNDSNDCQTATTPCATLGGPLGKTGFVSGDTVLVGGGVYTSTGDEVLSVDKGVRYIGGWNDSFTAQSLRSTIDGQQSRRGITITGNFPVALERFTVKRGSSNRGGGIYNYGALTLKDSTVKNNNSSEEGGGIFNHDSTLLLVSSTISGNAASGKGGGIFGGITISINSTVTSNTANLYGGGVSGNAVKLVNSTITENVASSQGGGIYSSNIISQNSILAGNSASSLGPDCKGAITTWGYNLIGDTSDCVFTPVSGDITNVDPVLSPLVDNGGPTFTHALLTGSPAIDAGNPFVPGSRRRACEVGDQRGVGRPVGTACDIGAFEGVVDKTLYPPIKTYSAKNKEDLPGKFLCDHLKVECTDGDDPHADAAHAYASDTYGFYFKYHARDSVDGAEMLIISSVHYRKNYANAFWSSAIQQMVYGDAYGFPMADDVVAHELTHGVTDYESNLFYYYQSGAINESFSDMWGEFVDQTNGAGDDRKSVKWLIGEDVTGLGAIRDMENPPAFGHPDKMSSPKYYTGDADYGRYGDNGGVHINSGVNNKAVYLMTDGGDFNGYKIASLGIAKVAAIYYEVQTNLLTSGADFKDLYNALYQACMHVVGGADGITYPDCVEVRKATDAVEMDQEPAAKYNPEAAVCPEGKFPVDLFYADFEDGTGEWVFKAVKGTSSWKFATGYATSGTGLLWGDDAYTRSDSYAMMKSYVALPTGPRSYLHFNQAFGFEYPDYDGGWLEYRLSDGSSWIDARPLFEEGLNYNGVINKIIGNGDNRHTGRKAFVGDSHGYGSSRYNLRSLAGKSVRFRWRMSTDSIFRDWGWFIDDVRIYTCAASPSLAYTGHTIDDDNVGSSSGDGDGKVDCGETIELTVDLKNSGTKKATGVSAELSTDDEYITPTPYNVSSSYPDILINETQQNLTSYVFTVDPSTPYGYIIPFDLDVTASNGGPWSEPFGIFVSCGSSPVPNDDFDNALEMSSLPYNKVQNTRKATSAVDDPILSCVGSQKYNTVWYKHTPSASGIMTVDTFGSGFDTILGVWTGSRGSLKPVLGGCKDDSGGPQSKVSFGVAAGTTFYIEVASHASKISGSLEISASFKSNPAVLIKNASFEKDSNKDGIPNSWKGVKLTKDDGRTCTVARHRSCSFKMVGSGKSKQLTQLVLMGGLAGESFTLSGLSKASQAGGAGKYSVKVMVKHLDGTSMARVLNFSVGTHNWESKQVTFKTKKPYTRMIVTIIYSKPKGTVWFDKLSLVKN